MTCSATGLYWWRWPKATRSRRTLRCHPQPWATMTKALYVLEVHQMNTMRGRLTTDAVRILAWRFRQTARSPPATPKAHARKEFDTSVV